MIKFPKNGSSFDNGRSWEDSPLTELGLLSLELALGACPPERYRKAVAWTSVAVFVTAYTGLTVMRMSRKHE